MSLYLSLLSNAPLLTLFLPLFAGVMYNIFDGLTDKDEQVRQAMQLAIVKILETHPLRATIILTEYRTKNAKLSEQSVAMLLE